MPTGLDSEGIFTHILCEINLSVVMLRAKLGVLTVLSKCPTLSHTHSLRSQVSMCATTKQASIGNSSATWDPTWFGLRAHPISNNALGPLRL